jgi:hypothetical protein
MTFTPAEFCVGNVVPELYGVKSAIQVVIAQGIASLLLATYRRLYLVAALTFSSLSTVSFP